MNNIAGITRIRNESLIIADTISHYLKRCDHLFVYDDASTDDTVRIVEETGGDRVTVMRGKEWAFVRRPEETLHRHLMLEAARAAGYAWALCFDADERLEGQLPDLNNDSVHGYTFRLFDGYLTREMQEPYNGGDLAQLPRMWGPEYRDILILFRIAASRFIGDGNRCPRVVANAIRPAPAMFVKHFGKCLSVQHWEETCAYYTHEGWSAKYRDKWEARKGKAIHTTSDRGRPLRTWERLMVATHRWSKL